MRIVVLGGGFGGVTTARHLEQLLRGHADVEITLVSRENFFVLTPLLFEACSGRLEATTPFVFRPLGAMASLGHTRVAPVFGVRLSGFLAWWIRRTYYLFQMPRWDRRLRIVLDWTVALFFRPDITKVELHVEREQVGRARDMAAAVHRIGHDRDE